MNISILKADLIMLWILAATSLCLGLLVNQFRDKALPLVYQTKEERVMKAVGEFAHTQAAKAASAAAALPEYVGLEEFRSILEQGGGIIVDARPEIFHRLGHVPGALSLPRKDFQKGYATHKQRLEADKSATIVIYCSGSSCEDSDLLRKALHSLDYNRVTVFKGGWSAWTAAGLPEERNL